MNEHNQLIDELFDLKYALYKEMVFRICYSYLNNVCDSEDVFQDIFIKYYQSNKIFDSINHEKYWLIRVSINSCINHLKHSWKKKIILDNDYVEELKAPQANNKMYLI